MYLAEDQEAVLGCVQKKANNQTPTAADGCFEMGQQFPLGCSETWTNTQVIVEVPEVGFQEYALALINNSLFSTDGAKTFEVQNGAPKPSICSLTTKVKYRILFVPAKSRKKKAFANIWAQLI